MGKLLLYSGIVKFYGLYKAITDKRKLFLIFLLVNFIKKLMNFNACFISVEANHPNSFILIHQVLP